jgi:hypothetical protein
MIRTLTLGFFVFALTAGPAAAACMGPSPAITHVGVQFTNSRGGLNTYHIVGTVTNLGSAGQPSNTLQFVEIYDAQTGIKLDSRGIQPISEGASAHFSYAWQRSSEAAAGSSTLLFRMYVEGSTCAKSSYKLTL